MKKVFYNNSFDYQTRALLQFPLSDWSGSTVENDILEREHRLSRIKYTLKMYEADGNTNLSTAYELSAYPLSQSWDEGTGKFGDNPKVTNGVSWDNRNNYPNSTAVSWSAYENPATNGSPRHGGYFLTSSGTEASQSFSYESPDINMDVTRMVRRWLGNTNQNHGLMLRLTGSQETDDTTFANLKFFSSNTNTIYTPKLEAAWTDVHMCTGSQTSSMTELSMTGDDDNYVYPIGLKESYHKDENVKFRFGVRKRYIQKSFSTSVQTISGSYIADTSGSYSIVDVATGETIIPFDDSGESYSKTGCDGTYNYFNQWLSGFEPNRTYKILLRIKYNDGQEEIYDNGFEFNVRN